MNLCFILLYAFSIQKTVLENGLEVYLIQNPIAPITTVRLSFDAGSTYEGSTTNGIFHLFEHMLFKGNRTYKDQLEFARRVRELGILYNGSTSTEEVEYHYTVLKDFLKDAMFLMREAILYPEFDSLELQKEKTVVIDEYNLDYSMPEYRLYKEVEKIFYGDDFPRRHIIGSKEAVQNATRDMLIEMHKRYYTPENCNFIVSGNFDTDETLQWIKELFRNWSGTGEKYEIFPVKGPEKSKTITIKGNSERALVYLLFKGPDVGEETKDTYTADLLTTILNLPGSKFQEVFVDSKLATRAKFSYYTQKYTGELSFLFETLPERVKSLKKKILKVLNEMGTTDYFSDSLLKVAKNKIETNFLLSREDPISFADEFSFWVTVAGYSYYNDYLDNIRDKSLKDIQEFIDIYLREKPFVLGIFLPEEK